MREKRSIVVSFLLLSILFLGFSSSVQANLANHPLDLILEPAPDIYSGFLDVSYTAANDSLSVEGYAMTLDMVDIPDGWFSLSAKIDETGGLGAGGQVSITGTVSGYSGTLISGDLIRLGYYYEQGYGRLEFKFDVTGGELESLYAGMPGGIILYEAGYPGNFDSDFDNNGGFPGFGSGYGSTVPTQTPTPEPATMSLFALGIIATTLRKRSIL